MQQRRTFIRTALAAGLAALCAASALSLAQDRWPSKPITYIVPFPPGGTTDVLARIIGQKLGAALGTTIVVENKPGAGGNVGSEVVAKAAPDGYTILGGTISSHAINVSLYPKLPYDPVTSFQPITLIGTNPNILVVNASSPYKSVQDITAELKAKPGSLSYASAGNGTSHHLAGELFKLQTKTFITHIPYRGAGPALQDLISGQVDMMFDGMGSSAAHIKGGRIKALAVAAERRAPGFAELPTSLEAGGPDYKVSTWYGIWAPKGTPKEVVDHLQSEMKKAMTADDIKAQWNGMGAEVPTLYGADFGKFVSSEVKRWAEVVKASGAKLD